MARPRKTEAPDLARPVNLTAGVIARLTCPAGKTQAFLRDCEGNGLRVRVTPTGAKSFVFEQSLKNQTIRRTIGSVEAWTVERARAEAKRLSVLLDAGTDPRELEREQDAAKAAEAERQAAGGVTVAAAWRRYAAEGSPKRRDAWKPRYVADMAKMVEPGGVAKKRGEGLTMPGHLAALLPLRLVDINEDRLADWFATERKRSKHQATRALMMFRGFLRWCSTRPEFRELVNPAAGRAPSIVDSLPEVKKRTDALEAAQVKGWWEGVTQLPNPTAGAYLRALLLTGARREEMAALQWQDVDFRWRKLTIADKVADSRTIPLSDYVASMLAALPRGKGADGNPSPFVFASASKSGRIADPRASHEKALRSAGVSALSLHGLRRSFSLLGEAAGAPAGAIAQVMGHRPSATAEGYRPRSVDALRPYLQRIEDYILSLAGVQFDATGAGPIAVERYDRILSLAGVELDATAAPAVGLRLATGP